MDSQAEQRPLLIYDGDCGFCQKWISFWQSMTGDSVQYAPSQEVGKRYPQISSDVFDKAVILVMPDGTHYKGADAVIRALATVKHLTWARILHGAYKRLPGFSQVAEALYSFVAKQRPLFSKLTALMPKESKQSTYGLSRWIFLRFLALIYFMAFASVSTQLIGLAGSEGVIGSLYSDSQLRLFPILGMVGSVFLLLDVAPFFFLLALWWLYFVLAQICQDFFWFQWDSLMLEMGFLAVFLAPWTLLPKGPQSTHKESAPSITMILLFRWLLFRLVFHSGWVKLASGDPNWRNLTALMYHFETQPLPTWVAWYVHQLPLWIHRVLNLGMFVIELVVPFFLFFPVRKLRIAAALILAGFQVMIDLTGNYGFFGWQTVGLCVLALDDEFWLKLWPKKWPRPTALKPTRHEHAIKKFINYAVAALVLLISVFHVPRLSRWVSSLRIVNQYGVFAVMTTQRDEIVIEGSADGKTWMPYEFKWKPGDVTQRPRFVEPHMPRLDWQMWFASLSNFTQEPWMTSLLVRLLLGSPPVTDLFAKNPFVDKPPRFVRALRYEYHLTVHGSKDAKEGAWWTRTLKGAYSPSISLNPKPKPED